MSRIYRYLLPLLFCSLAISQSWYNHPELDWQTIESDHFLVHFHYGTERSAREAAVVAEKVYGPLTELYQHEPDSKTHIIIQDVDDYSNGGAYFYDNKIVIWALPLDFDLRGAHRWMQNVISHEFTHIIQIQAAMKYSRQVPGVYLQHMGYEDEKRDDVLYGFPNVIASYPIPGTAVPPWLAEGTAQHMHEGADFDFWDSHRDMIIRDKSLNNNVFSFDEMNTFGKRGIGNECIYNHGFGFVEYLTSRFDEDVLHRITAELSKPTNYSVNKAMEKATGIKGKQLHADWILHLAQDYHDRVGHIIKDEVKGFVLESEGTTNVHPVWAPDGDRFAFLSNRDHDYFSQTDLFLYSFSDSSSKKITGGVHSAPTWVNDSTLIYSKRSLPNKVGSRFLDLYRYDLIEEDEERLTHDARLISPAYDPISNRIAAITTFDGTSNIVVSPADSINFSPITARDNGLQILSLTWMDSERLLCDALEAHGRELYIVSLETREFTLFSGDPAKPFDLRDPVANGNSLVFSSNKSGIHNLMMQEVGGSHGYITNVLGGAFMPDISDDGRILYSLYENGTYKVAVINSPEDILSDQVGYSSSYHHTWPESELINYGSEAEAKPYQDSMPRPFILPRLMVDYKTLKPGAYLYAIDVLSKLSIFGGASMNSKKDKDLFLLFEFMKFRPTLYTNLFWASRNITENTLLYGINPAKSDLSIQFFSADIGARFPVQLHKFWIQYTYTRYRETINQVIENDTGQIAGQGGIGFDYFRGHNISLRWLYRIRKPEFAGRMLPSNGYTINTRIAWELNDFMNGFAFNEEYSSLQPEFVENNTYRYTVDLAKHWTLNHPKKIVSSFITKIEAVSNDTINDFFHFYGGGLIGMKGYTFYDPTLSGTALWINTAVVRMPVFMEKSYGLAHLSLQNMSVGLIGQIGGGFYGQPIDWIRNEDYKMSAGVEVRLGGYSFYAYPLAVTYEYHVPINDVDTKGKHYLTVLFDFGLSNDFVRGMTPW